MGFDVVVVGGGVNGLFTALDLSLRGFKVLLLERGSVGSGTSGRMHGLLHSGARYVVTDPRAAVECIEENRIMARIAPHAIEDTTYSPP
jgi:glycerol-3-phosphate dehydrogenase